MESINRVLLPVFLGDVEFKAALYRSNFGGEVASYSIGEVRGVVQVVQNWLAEILYRTEVRGWNELASFYRMS